MESTVGIALLGRGTVGGGVAALLDSRRAQIEARSGTAYRLIGIGSRRRDPLSLASDSRADLVVETIGGCGVALECIERALVARKHVVTANKDVIATQGPRLRALAAANGVVLRYEASVASAIPVLSTIDGPLAGEAITTIGGVLNGTCNFILSLMREGHTFAAALARAQAAGYAEADPRSDIDGTDAAHKLAILLQHTFGPGVVTNAIAHGGIRGLTTGAVRRARQHGFDVKLVALAQKYDDHIRAQVGPVLVPFAHTFARVHGIDNIVRLRGASCGLLTFCGPGAGGDAAASAVLGDVIAALRAIAGRHTALAPRAPYSTPAIRPAFDRFPVFAGLPILQPTQGDTHVGEDPRTLSAV